MQTLNGLAHVNYKMPGSFSYAEVFAVARQLRLTAQDAEQIFRRMAFNIIARNHDDHSKNIAFIMRDKTWQLAPAYDLAYSYKPGSPWVNSHWMSLNGKRDNFNRNDFYSLESLSPLFSRTKINNIINEIREQVAQWPTLARKHEVPKTLSDEINLNLRLTL
jgi:serine/threonine-protein kinase HipA